jgi:anaerobic selenocysteine-containing dehydrogenase
VNRGSLCAKCTLAYNGAWLDPQERLAHPQRRVGRKGDGEFEQISWETALDLIAENITKALEASGGETVLYTHYTGTVSQIAYSFPARFFNRIGATEVDPDSVCNKAGHEALRMIFGSSLDGFDPRTARESKSILIWGANPSVAAPHAHRNWLRELRQHATVVVIDPIRHKTAEMAHVHLQPQPGTDAALAFALLNVMRREALLDERFLAHHVDGWAEVEAKLDTCTPVWAETVTRVPAALIEKTALIYGQGPSLLWLGQGLQRQTRGGNVMRACALLPVATGNIGKPGAGILYMNGPASRGINTDYLTSSHLNANPKAISHMDLAARLEDSEKTRMLFTYNNNIAASNPQQGRLRNALAREDLFTVVLDLFQTDTANYADVLLPAASFLEFDDLIASYFDYSVSAQAKVAEPIGEALPNQEIFRRLARAMRLPDPELVEEDETILAKLMADSGTDLTFAQLAVVGTVDLSTQPVVAFQDRLFPTSSGRIQVASDLFSAAGLPRAPEPHADAPPNNGKLRLLSPASPWSMNTSYGNDPKIRERAGHLVATLHPDEAARRGVRENDRALLETEVGELPVRIAISMAVPEGVVLVPKGRWLKHEPSGANINFLNPGLRSDIADNTAVHSVEVRLTRIVEEIV